MPTLAGPTTADNIRAEMARRRIQQAAVADVLGISRTQVGERLAGRVPWSVDEARAVAELLGVPIAALIPS